MEEAIQQPEAKISIVVGVLGTLVGVILDLLSLIPLVGDVEEMPVGIIVVLNVISGMGTVVLVVQGVVMVLKAIPVVQEFPLWTAAWLFTWYSENHPSALTAKLNEVAAIAGVAEGDVGGLAEAGEEVGAITESTVATTEAAEASEASVAGVEAEEAAAAAESGGAESMEASEEAERAQSENARPSEERTERGSEESETKKRVKEEAKERLQDAGGGSGGDEEDEDEKEEASNERYEEMTTPEAEKDPILIAKEAELGDEVPVRRPQEIQEGNTRQKESPATKRLSERFAREQEKLRRLREGGGNNSEDKAA